LPQKRSNYLIITIKAICIRWLFALNKRPTKNRQIETMEYTSYSELKLEFEKRFSVLMKASGMFFAFSDQQMEEGKKDCPLEPGDEYIRTYAGGVMPKSKSKDWNKDTDELQVWMQQTIKENNLQESHIIYELRNHEAFYTGDIKDSMMSLPYYSEVEVRTVFYKYLALGEDND
jgi:hypothetical protein